MGVGVLVLCCCFVGWCGCWGFGGVCCCVVVCWWWGFWCCFLVFSFGFWVVLLGLLGGVQVIVSLGVRQTVHGKVDQHGTPA
ncbi:hypothetical protein, partial [Pseudomonas syringae group genomosp. 7]|uniref:hypothetical protein n=1 Tax=Pseudomonas syringae group genomosp. 7 TaxID=251699 RepID=UPI00376FC1C1